MTEEVWRNLHSDGCLTHQEELLARVYLGGVVHPIRKEVGTLLRGWRGKGVHFSETFLIIVEFGVMYFSWTHSVTVSVYLKL